MVEEGEEDGRSGRRRRSIGRIMIMLKVLMVVIDPKKRHGGEESDENDGEAKHSIASHFIHSSFQDLHRLT